MPNHTAGHGAELGFNVADFFADFHGVNPPEYVRFQAAYYMVSNGEYSCAFLPLRDATVRAQFQPRDEAITSGIEFAGRLTGLFDADVVLRE